MEDNMLLLPMRIAVTIIFVAGLILFLSIIGNIYEVSIPTKIEETTEIEQDVSVVWEHDTEKVTENTVAVKEEVTGVVQESNESSESNDAFEWNTVTIVLVVVAVLIFLYFFVKMIGNFVLSYMAMVMAEKNKTEQAGNYEFVSKKEEV